MVGELTIKSRNIGRVTHELTPAKTG